MESQLAAKKTNNPPAAVGERRGYPGIDRFRLVAAFLVIAIHTSPLFSVSPEADFILTRALARVAVPFFFMATGFFLPQGGGVRSLGGFAKKIGILCAASILLYLPLNIYGGYFAQPGLAVHILRDILFDGTFYHLWYFPAVLLGAVIAKWLYEKMGPAAFAVAGVLYVIGLGGDSYHGLVTAIPGVKAVYDVLFLFFDYTRNGLFFAPLFIMLGLHAANGGRESRYSIGVSVVCFGGSLILMLEEALLLDSAGFMLHDSMYILLPFCLWFLFDLLRRPAGTGSAVQRRIATLIYILHPWCIVLVRGAAGAVGVKDIVVGSSPLFYLCVSLLSLGIALLLSLIPPFWRGRPRKAKARAWAELDEDALVHNLHAVRGLLPAGAELMAVVKADAYGHGAAWVARSLQRQGVRAFAVASLAEGIALRRAGVRGTVLVLGYTPPEEARTLRFWRLTQTAVDLPHARALSQQGLRLHVHLKADTGMHRLGIPAGDLKAFCEAYTLPNLQVDGVFTHLARADGLSPEDEAFTDAQIAAWYALLEALRAAGIRPGKCHFQSSYGLLNRPGLPCDYARVGIALTGALAQPVRANVQLRSVLSLRARVASVHSVGAGQWVGYGKGRLCKQNTLLATVTAGYADGIPRGLQGGRALAGGQSWPITGTVCMDQLFIENGPDVCPGDVVTLIGRDGDACITAAELAQNAGTLPNEIFAHIGPRVLRIGGGQRSKHPARPKAVFMRRQSRRGERWKMA